MPLGSLVPGVLKALLRPLPQTVPIALRAPQDAVRLCVVADGMLDVTERCVIISLAPFKVGIRLPIETRAARHAQRLDLAFQDAATGTELALMRLRLDSTLQLDLNQQLAIFDVLSASQRCVRWPYRAWNQWLQDRAFRRKSKDTLGMTAKGVQHTMIFYICPRPVVLVSVSAGAQNNLFPMDLIGPVSAERFTLALRTTSPSISTMKETRRVALSDMPASLKPTIYKLGAHHSTASIDLRELPFDMRRSTLFSLPVPSCALRVRELEILGSHSMDSHTLFVTRIVSDERYQEGEQLFHVSGNYQYFRQRDSRAFALVP
jgi:flavin reductase (DIM6/NTAB) family NADH-FMN oxidoreductase RutF